MSATLAAASDCGGGDVDANAQGRGQMIVSDNAAAAAATVMAAMSMVDGGIDCDNDPMAAAISDDAASSTLKKRTAIKQN